MAFDTANQRLAAIQMGFAHLVPWSAASGFHAEDAAVVLGTMAIGADEGGGGGGGGVPLDPLGVLRPLRPFEHGGLPGMW